MPQSIETKKDRYNCHRKEVCDNKDVYKPKHTHTLILCLLEEILEKIKNVKCCCENNGDSESIENNTTQSGLVNINLDSLTNKK